MFYGVNIKYWTTILHICMGMNEISVKQIDYLHAQKSHHRIPAHHIHQQQNDTSGYLVEP